MHRLMTREEAAEYLCKPRSWLKYAERRRIVPFIRVGQQIRYRRTDLERWVEACRVPAGSRSSGDT